MARAVQQFALGQNRARRLKRLHKVLSHCPKVEMLGAFWVLDRAHSDAHFKKPNGYDYPDEFLFAKIGEPVAIHPWEIETLVTEMLACDFHQGPRMMNVVSWSAIAVVINSLRGAENAEAALVPPAQIHRQIFRILHRQLSWQIHSWNTADAVRWWYIFKSDLLQEIFEEHRELKLKPFLKLGMAWSAIFMAKQFSALPISARRKKMFRHSYGLLPQLWGKRRPPRGTTSPLGQHWGIGAAL